MKILIVSDTHRRDGNLQEVIERTAPFDMLIHLGDAEGSEDRIEAWCREQNADCEVHMILGNNDFFSSLRGRRRFRLETIKRFCAMGTSTAFPWDTSAWWTRRGTGGRRSPCSDIPISPAWTCAKVSRC